MNVRNNYGETCVMDFGLGFNTRLRSVVTD